MKIRRVTGVGQAVPNPVKFNMDHQRLSYLAEKDRDLYVAELLEACIPLGKTVRKNHIL